MSKQTVRAAAFANIHKITALLGVAATLPLAVFVTSNMLKYELGIWPGLQIPSIHPAILIGGVLIALMMNAWSILDVKVSKTGRGVRVVAEITATSVESDCACLRVCFLCDDGSNPFC